MQDELFDLRIEMDASGALREIHRATFALTLYTWRQIGARQRDVQRRVAWQKVMKVKSMYLVAP